MLASLVYLIAPIYGVGLIASRFVGLQFEIGVLVGLAGILFCSFLGGMRAVTWTQAMQYVVLVIAYLVPVAILSWQITDNPVAPLAYGQTLQRVGELERVILKRPEEIAVRAHYREQAEELRTRIDALPDSLRRERERLNASINELKRREAPLTEMIALERQRRALPSAPDEARSRWSTEMRVALARASEPVRHAEAYPASDEAGRDSARVNFLALYLAVLAKQQVYSTLVGIDLAQLPAWVNAWGKLGLVAIQDIS